MRYTTDKQRAADFRDWLRGEMRRLGFYVKPADRYLPSDFNRYCEKQGISIGEVSLGRYIRAENPVLPTPELCAALATALGIPSLEVKIQAGYVTRGEIDAWLARRLQRAS